MSVRLPLSVQTRQMLLGLQRTQDRLAQNTQRISSGQRITNPGDDPAGSALILDLGTSLGANTQFQQQMDSALSFLQGTGTALSSVTDSLTQLLQLGQQGLSDLTSASGRAALASSVDGIETNLVGLANTQIQGKYIFSGTTTLTQPFTQNAGGTVVYNGNLTTALNPNTYSLNVSQSSSVVMNVPGDTLFFGANGSGSNTDLFKAVNDLSTGLKANNSANIQSAYDRLQGILSTLTQAQTDVGGRVSRLNDLKTIVSSQSLSLQSMQNTVQDTNYPDAITQFTSDQTVQSATLNALGKTNQPNLFNYLG